jgi:hypothetical protein
VPDIREETRAFIIAALAGDPALASLSVVGVDSETLTATIAPGRPPAQLEEVTYSPQVPFLRETLVELVVRMQRTRWRRLDTYTLSLVSATDEDLDKLRRYGPMQPEVGRIGCECGPGWHDMLDSVFSLSAKMQPDSLWKVSQLKEKFGGLRLYHYGASDDVEELIDAAEHLSEHVCDVCGALGTKSNHRGWVATRCADHKEDDE